MGDHHATGGDLRRDLGQHARDVLIRQAVEAVTTDALVVEPPRQREPVGELRMTAVERGVEAGHLRQVGLDRGDRADAGEIVRLMQRRERTERLQLGEHRRTDAHRRHEVDTAMHHPVTDAEQRRPIAEMLAQPAADHAEELAMTRAALVGPAPIDQHPAVGVRGNEARRRADALDLALGRQLSWSGAPTL